MTNPDYVHVGIIADRSGSMGEIADPPDTKAQATTKGIRELVKDQQALPGKATFSLTHFDTVHDTVEDFGDGSKTLAWHCEPRNGTALLDAIGFEITRLGAAFAAMEEDDRPGQVFLVIGTDGYENSSREYTLDQVKALIAEHQDKYGWDVIFIGAGIDAFSSGASMNVSYASTLASSGAAMGAAYASTNSAVTRSRYSGQSVSYTDEERAKSS